MTEQTDTLLDRIGRWMADRLQTESSGYRPYTPSDPETLYRTLQPGDVPSDEELAGTWGWVEVRDHQKLYRTLVEEGFVHHASMIHGDQTQALLQVCKFLDIQPVVVG